MKKKALLLMTLLLTGCNANKIDANSSNKPSDVTTSITASSSTINDTNSLSSDSTITTASKTSVSKFDRKIRIYLNPSIQTRNL